MYASSLRNLTKTIEVIISRLQGNRSLYKNQLYFYTPVVKNPKMKLRT